jgi:cyclase
MHKLRVLARLDVKNSFVIKGINLEGLRKVGNPVESAKDYYQQGIDEILFMDAVASLYGRNNLFNIIEEACKDVFVPITIGGGVRSLDDFDLCLKSGADKVSLNTQAVKTPEIISHAAKTYGSQCVIGSIEAKKKGNQWEVYIDNGREETGRDVIEWAKELEDRGVGEILLTSVDYEGMKKGFDIELLSKINKLVTIPVIASGGCGEKRHIKDLIDQIDVSAVALASVLHYKKENVEEIKSFLVQENIPVRHFQDEK